MSNRVRWTRGARLATPRRSSATCRIDCRGRGGVRGSRVITNWADIRDPREAIAIAIAPREAERVRSGSGQGQRGVYIPLDPGIMASHRPSFLASHSATPLTTRPCRAGVLASPGSRTARNQGLDEEKMPKAGRAGREAEELGQLARCHPGGNCHRARYPGKWQLQAGLGVAGGRYSGCRPLAQAGRGKQAGRYSGPGRVIANRWVLPPREAFQPSQR